MYLSRLEERMLSGEYGDATRVAMELVVKVGEALGAERLIEIRHAHASGISYDNIGDAGLEFLETLYTRGARTRVFATYNPVGMCVELEPPKRLAEDPGFVEKQMKIIKMLNSMGFYPSITCIPYTIRRPSLGEHLAWGESSAVAVANTLYGARTNREGGPLALAAALTGRTYYWGLHIAENRVPTVRIAYSGRAVNDEVLAGLIGYYMGLHLSDQVPYVDAKVAGERQVIAMCAAAAASGNIAMCIVREISPEYNLAKSSLAELERVHIDDAEINAIRENIETASIDEAELFFTGCPHHGASFLHEVASYLASKNIARVKKEVWIAIPGYEASRVKQLASELRRKNVYVLPGTCIVVSRLKGRVDAIATDSLKTAFYMPRRHGVRVALTNIWEFIRRYSE